MRRFRIVRLTGPLAITMMPRALWTSGSDPCRIGHVVAAHASFEETGGNAGHPAR
jgi:hypothetical protein